MSRFREFLRRYPRGGALFFTRRVNRPVGSLLAALLFESRVTPNMISIAGFAVHVIAAVILIVVADQTPTGAWLLILVLWQVAFSLDCADGQLARARQSANPFGAWLDIFMDVVTHVIVYGVLVVHVSRALDLDGVGAALLTSAVMGGHLIQLFTSFGHSVLGSEPAVSDPPGWLRLSMQARHALDYGGFLFIAGVLLPWPRVLVIYLVVSSTLHAAVAVIRLYLNWRREHARR